MPWERKGIDKSVGFAEIMGDRRGVCILRVHGRRPGAGPLGPAKLR